MERVASSWFYPYIPPPPGQYTQWTAYATSANVVPEGKGCDKKRALMAAVRYLRAQRVVLVEQYGEKYVQACEYALFHEHPLVPAWIETDAAVEEAHRLRAANGRLLVELREAQDRKPEPLPDRKGTIRCIRCQYPVETKNARGKTVRLADSVTCPLCTGDQWLCTDCLPHSGWRKLAVGSVCPECS